MRVRNDGAWREVTAGRVRIGGEWKRLTSARAYVGGAWEDVAVFLPPLSLTISPPTASAAIVGPGTATTGSVTATPAGGQTPITYSWTRLSGVGAATNSTSATTAFSQFLNTGDDVSGTFRCTATDAFGTTATADITATFTSTDPFGA